MYKGKIDKFEIRHLFENNLRSIDSFALTLNVTDNATNFYDFA